MSAHVLTLCECHREDKCDKKSDSLPGLQSLFWMPWKKLLKQLEGLMTRKRCSLNNLKSSNRPMTSADRRALLCLKHPANDL